MSRFAFPVSPLTLRQWGLLALTGSAVALSGCGGGSRAKAYSPDAIVSFGDEYSAISDPVTVDGGTVQGLVYTVNQVTSVVTGYCTDQTLTNCADGAKLSDVSTFTGASTAYKMLDPTTKVNVVTKIELGSGASASATYAQLKRTTDTSYLCNSPTIWTQVLAHALNLGYRTKCSTDYAGATTYAVAGAKAADVAAQINAHIGEITSKTLVTVMAGQNDVIELFDNTSLSQADKVAQAKARALVLAAAVKQILVNGGHVVLANVPNIAYSPYGVAKTSASSCASTSVSCNGDLEKVVEAFNASLIETGLVDYATDGRHLGHVDAEVLITTYAKATSSYNTSVQACNTSAMARPDGTADASDLRYCNSDTLVGTATYLWADDRHMAIASHAVVGSQAYTRASNQF